MAKINEEQIKKFAKVFHDITEMKISNFTKPRLFPPKAEKTEDYPYIINFFFATTVLNFRFWKIDKNGYYSLKEKVNNRIEKGSDILYAKAYNVFRMDKNFFNPKNLKNCYKNEIKKILPNDFSEEEKESRIILLKNYAKSLIFSPMEILEVVNRSFIPLENFRKYLKSVVGYKEDYFGKKIELLAMLLACRPEKFLAVKINNSNWRPIIDYHWIRFTLRTGMIIVGEKIAKLLKLRKLVNQKIHDSIRMATYQANKLLRKYSGKSIIALDQYVWRFMREVCIYEKEPKCQKCPFQEICKKKTALFQPIYKTNDY